MRDLFHDFLFSKGLLVGTGEEAQAPGRDKLAEANNEAANRLKTLIKDATVENPWGTWLVNGQPLYKWAESKG